MLNRDSFSVKILHFYSFYMYFSYLEKKIHTLFIIHNIFNYFLQIFLLGSASIKNFSTNLFFEPVSLISNEIVKLLNGRIEWSQISFF